MRDGMEPRDPDPRDDLLDRLGGDVPPDELARLREVDALLRSVPAPPPRADVRPLVPPARRRPARSAALAVAAVLVVALAFAAGTLLRSGGGFEAEASVALAPAVAGPSGASGELRLARPDGHGNRALEVDVRGLPAGRGVYALGVVRPGGRMWRCGTFTTGTGAATVRMTVPYEISEDADWVVSRAGVPVLRGRETG